MRHMLAVSLMLTVLWPIGSPLAAQTTSGAQAEEYSDPLILRPTVHQNMKGHQPSNKGIHVGQPKVFDDRSLQLMLNAAEQRLATLQAIDQACTT